MQFFRPGDRIIVATTMHDADRPEGERNRIFCDRGLQGIADHLPGTAPMIPYKRTKKSPLTREQREHNSRINSERVLVEHSIGRLKRYDRITDPYDGTAAQFNREFNVITGLVNLRHDPQLKIKSFSSNSYRSMFPNKQILRGYAENCAILCPSANYESSLCTCCGTMCARRPLRESGRRQSTGNGSAQWLP